MFSLKGLPRTNPGHFLCEWVDTDPHLPTTGRNGAPVTDLDGEFAEEAALLGK
jgi:hypothetical protein